MGFYLQANKNFGKAMFLIEEYEAVSLPVAPAWEEIPEDSYAVCVVLNPAFEAAGVAYSKEELDVFKHPDGRMKWWLLMKKDIVHSLCPELARFMK